MSDEDAILVLTTTGSRDEAASIAASLVESRLAGCVQIVSQIESFYRWEGSVAHDADTSAMSGSAFLGSSSAERCRSCAFCCWSCASSAFRSFSAR